MSTTQTLSNIATGLRAVDCELAAMRSLNGTLVSALTTRPRVEAKETEASQFSHIKC